MFHSEAVKERSSLCLLLEDDDVGVFNPSTLWEPTVRRSLFHTSELNKSTGHLISMLYFYLNAICVISTYRVS